MGETSGSPRGFLSALEADNKILKSSTSEVFKPSSDLNLDDLAWTRPWFFAIVAGLLGLTAFGYLVLQWRPGWSGWIVNCMAGGDVALARALDRKRKKRMRQRKNKKELARKHMANSTVALAEGEQANLAVESSVALTASSLARGLGLNPADLDPKTKLELVRTALDTENLRLRRHRNDTADSAHALEREKIASVAAEARVLSFRQRCADDMLAGCLVTCACFAAQCLDVDKQVSSALSSCPSGASGWGGPIHLPLPSFLSGGLDDLARACCLARVAVTRAGGYALAAYFSGKVLRHAASASAGYHAHPVAFVLLLMGLGVGGVAERLVASWGGSGRAFFVIWMATCSAHCALVSFSSEVVRWVDAGGSVWRPAAVHVTLVAALPAAAGFLPFHLGDL